MRLKTLASVALIGISGAALAQMTPHHGKKSHGMSNGMMANSMMSNSMSGGMSPAMGNSTMDNAVVTPDTTADANKM